LVNEISPTAARQFVDGLIQLFDRLSSKLQDEPPDPRDAFVRSPAIDEAPAPLRLLIIDPRVRSAALPLS
jgi:hypothetical protein